MPGDERAKAASCFYQNHEYSDGALVCQSGKLMRCNDGTWQDTGDLCPAPPTHGPHQRAIHFESNRRLETTVTHGEALVGNRLESEAKACDYGGPPTVISPKITITDGNITVTQWSIGSAHVQSTYLNGTGGEYSFGDGGSYKIQPGTYEHKILGNIVVGAGAKGGCIVSKVTYK
jgi:hypothetical protein